MLFVWIIVALVVLVAIYVLVTYNGLVSMRNRIENAWAQIDVQLKRRYDLIPNLVETVKGYASHERGTLEAVVQARNMAMTAQGPQDQAAAENMITGALKSVFALSEAYPDLKANQNFLNLQEELTGTEGRIAYARQFYNDTVSATTPRSRRCPSNVIANQFSFAEREYFEVDDAARGNVEVDFGAAPDRRSRRRRRRAPAGPHRRLPSDPPKDPDPRVYDQVAQNKRRSFLLIARLRRPRAGRRRCARTSSSAAGPYFMLFALVLAGGAAAAVRTGSRTRSRSRVSRARPASVEEYGRLHNIVEGLCIAGGLPKPRLYIVDDPSPNAFATGRDPKHAAVAVTTGLLEKMNRVELEGVLAHELSHIKNYDILVSTLAVTMVGVIAIAADIGIRFLWFGMGRSRNNRNDGGGERAHRHPGHLRVRAARSCRR